MFFSRAFYVIYSDNALINVIIGYLSEKSSIIANLYVTNPLPFIDRDDTFVASSVNSA